MRTDEEIIAEIERAIKLNEAGIGDYVITLARRLPFDLAEKYIKPEYLQGRILLSREYNSLQHEIMDMTLLQVQSLRGRDLPIAYKTAYILAALFWLIEYQEPKDTLNFLRKYY